MKKRFFLFVFLIAGFSLQAQQQGSETKKNAFEIIASGDSLKKGAVKIHQDKKIEKLVNENASPTTSNVNGYRIQVFSSNVHRTAKEDAFNLERRLREAFPELPVYVSYSSPFWKVRVGDFLSQSEAKQFAEEIFLVFPKLRNETYTVRDKIIPAGAK
jgi:hypothetical protein